MIAAVMQPYFIPYIGYFQLMHAADVFISLDDAQYIERGYVNRNRIAEYSFPWFTLPVRKGSRDLAINQRHYAITASTIASLELRIERAYRRAPGFEQMRPVLSGILRHDDLNVAGFNLNALKVLARLLGLTVTFDGSSNLPRAGERGQRRIMSLCRWKSANCYVNPAGGSRLYDPDEFASLGIQLRFLSSCVEPESPKGHLSIIHLMMTTGIERTRTLLGSYALHPAAR